MSATRRKNPQTGSTKNTENKPRKLIIIIIIIIIITTTTSNSWHYSYPRSVNCRSIAFLLAV